MKDETTQTILEEASVAPSESCCTCPKNLHQELVRHNYELVNALKADPLDIANTLFSTRFICEDTWAKILLNYTPLEKATILVAAVRGRIQVAPKQYNEFLRILSEKTYTKDLLDILPLSNCQLHKLELRRSKLTDDLSKAICASGSEHSSSTSIDEYTLNPDDEADLEQQLTMRAEDMGEKFAELLFSTEESFRCQGLSPQQLVSGVLALTVHKNQSIGKPLLKREKKKLANAQDIRTVFAILSPHMTFFNYEILKILIKQLGSKKDRRKLQTYLHHFRNFCRRSVFEIPKDSLGHSPEKSVGQKYFHVLITKEFKSALLAKNTSSTSQICAPRLGISLNDAKYVQRKLSKVLKLNPTSLYLDFVSPGSTVLTFLLPEDVSLAGLDTDPEIIALSSNGIHLLCGPPGKPQPKEFTSNSLVVHWSQPEYGLPSLAKYILYYQKKCSETTPLSEWQKLELSSLETHARVPNLKDGDTYVFKICAVSDAGTLQYSHESDSIISSRDGGISSGAEFGAMYAREDLEQTDWQQVCTCM